jgi:hypothetical protein
LEEEGASSDKVIELSSETVAMLERLCVISPKQLAFYRIVFEKVDEDHDGTVTPLQVRMDMSIYVIPTLI